MPKTNDGFIESMFTTVDGYPEPALYDESAYLATEIRESIKSLYGELVCNFELLKEHKVGFLSFLANPILRVELTKDYDRYLVSKQDVRETKNKLQKIKKQYRVSFPGASLVATPVKRTHAVDPQNPLQFLEGILENSERLFAGYAGTLGRLDGEKLTLPESITEGSPEHRQFLKTECHHTSLLLESLNKENVDQSTIFTATLKSCCSSTRANFSTSTLLETTEVDAVVKGLRKAINNVATKIRVFYTDTRQANDEDMIKAYCADFEKILPAFAEYVTAEKNLKEKIPDLMQIKGQFWPRIAIELNELVLLHTHTKNTISVSPEEKLCEKIRQVLLFTQSTLLTYLTERSSGSADKKVLELLTALQEIIEQTLSSVKNAEKSTVLETYTRQYPMIQSAFLSYAAKDTSHISQIRSKGTTTCTELQRSVTDTMQTLATEACKYKK